MVSRSRKILCLSAAGLATLVASGQSEEAGDLEAFTGFAGEDPSMALAIQPFEGALGFSRSLVDTPRSVSMISSDLIDRIGVRDGDQLSRIVPGTYSVNRWGIAGSTQVRGLPADTYLRGMKRIDAQGNIRNVITMWESVEIVRGPPSPIFGNGRIGGYANYTPKSVRGTTGRYMEKPSGDFTLLIGSYDRFEARMNYAMPLTISEREAGIQIFALGSSSDSYYKDNFQDDRVLQASFAMNLNDRWRIESGGIYQLAVNAGQAGANRNDQYSLDNGLYMRGRPLVNLDTDGNGLVSESELQASRSYTTVGGEVVTSNVGRPLNPSFRAPLDYSIVGVPSALKDLLNLPEYAHVATTRVGRAILDLPDAFYVDASGNPVVGVAVPDIPIGMFLDPTQVFYDQRDWSLVAIEERAYGYTYTGYFDVIDSNNADATQRLQFLYDGQYQQKESQLPFNQVQNIDVAEVKYTGTRHASLIPLLNKLPDWADLNLLGSVNVRYTGMDRIASSGDYDHRRDLIAGYSPTDTFVSFLRTGDKSFETGEPISLNTASNYVEMGAGAMFDLTFFERLNFVGGGRYDYIDANTVDGERFSRFNASAATGTMLPRREADGTDEAWSRTISANYDSGILGMVPYVTVSRSSTGLTGSAQDIAFGNVNSGNILSEAKLFEVGVKGQIADGRLYYALTYYDQERAGAVLEEGESFVRATNNKGYEAELRWVPNRTWTAILSVTNLEITRIVNTGTRNAFATAEYLGFQDVVDPVTGEVLLPANALLWGGNPVYVIDNADPKFQRFGQYPEWVLGSFLGYNTDFGLRLGLSLNWVDSVAASSELPDLLILPSYFTANVSASYEIGQWLVSLQVRNALEEEYFVPNNGSFGGALLQPGLPRNYELSVTRKF